MCALRSIRASRPLGARRSSGSACSILLVHRLTGFDGEGLSADHDPVSVWASAPQGALEEALRHAENSVSVERRLRSAFDAHQTAAAEAVRAHGLEYQAH